MANAWLTHVKKTMKAMKAKGSYKKGEGLKKVILAAKKTYKKGKRGGADMPEEKVPVGGAGGPEPGVDVGGRRRKTRRRSSRR